MQVVLNNEDEGSSSGEADSVDSVIYIGRIGRHLEEKYIGRSRRRIVRI